VTAMTATAVKASEHVVRRKDRHHHAKLIKTAWQKSVAAIVETDQLLIDAKEDLEHGQFIAMVKDDLPFGERTAQYLMSIAQHRTLSNTKFFSYLPASWGTLGQLSRLPPDVLEHYLSDGTVTPDLKHEKAKDLVDRHCIREFASGKEIKVLPASAKLKGPIGVPGRLRRFCINRFTGEELSLEQAWERLLEQRLRHAIYLAQPNWGAAWPLWRSFKVTPWLIKNAEEASAAWAELIETLKRQADQQSDSDLNLTTSQER